jgi:hypothetical protein
MTLFAAIMTRILAGWLFILMGIILFRMLTGGIILTGLLRLEPRAPFGLDRLQLLAVTLFFAGGYIVASLYRGPGDKLPDIPTPLLLILIGSHGTYLSTRYFALSRRLGRGS